MSRTAATVLAIGLVASVPAHVSGQEATYSGGIQYAGGHYVFEDRTDAVYFNNGLRLRWDFVELGLSVPVAVQNGGLVTLVGGVPIPTGGTQSGVVSRRQGGRRIGSTSNTGSGGSGFVTAQEDDTTVAFDDDFRVKLADPTINAAVEVYSGFGTVRSVRVDSRVSVPINDLESGVGTGEWDYAIGASTAMAAGRLLIFADASYWWFGDLPELELQDGLSYGLGAGLPLRDGRVSVLLSLSGMTETIATVDPPLSLGASVGWALGERGFVSLGAGAGLTESSSDFFAQLGWSFRLSGDDPFDGTAR